MNECDDVREDDDDDVVVVVVIVNGNQFCSILILGLLFFVCSFIINMRKKIERLANSSLTKPIPMMTILEHTHSTCSVKTIPNRNRHNYNNNNLNTNDCNIRRGTWSFTLSIDRRF